ncbi:MAG: Putrescine aminotransferase [bacterium]|nr:Putrescine aminotransferase [bacterium]
MITPDIASENFIADSLNNWTNYLNRVYGTRTISAKYQAMEWSGEGYRIKDTKGKTYIDFLGGYGIFSLGHRHPAVVAAVKEQLDRLPLGSKELLHPQGGLLAKKMAEITPGDLKYSFFGNSGTEAVEGAIKLARLYTKKPEFICAENGYHGKTLGALSATYRQKFRTPFEPLVSGFKHVPFGEAAAIEAAITDQTAAVLLEPFQGEGGINIPPAGYLKKVRDICDRRGVLLILDEIQCGLGRTGKMWGCDHDGVAPDILCSAKALGGGVMPIGAFVGTEKVWAPLNDWPTIHTSTFGGNPLACAAALAALNVLEKENLPARAAQVGDYLIKRLRALAGIYPQYFKEVRGLGLFIGMEFHTDDIGNALYDLFFEKGVLVASILANPKIIRLEPPLIIDEKIVDDVITRFEDALQELGRR